MDRMQFHRYSEPEQVNLITKLGLSLGHSFKSGYKVSTYQVSRFVVSIFERKGMLLILSFEDLKAKDSLFLDASIQKKDPVCLYMHRSLKNQNYSFAKRINGWLRQVKAIERYEKAAKDND